MECYCQGIECTDEHTEFHLKTVQPMLRWIDQNVEETIFTEEFFVDSNLGYGGTADMLFLLKDGSLLLGDLKVKKDSYMFPMKPSMSYLYQLAAYRNHFEKLYGKMKTGNFLLASPFETRKKKGIPYNFLNPNKISKLKPYPYYFEDYSEGFKAAHFLWKHRYGLI